MIRSEVSEAKAGRGVEVEKIRKKDVRRELATSKWTEGSDRD